MGYLLNLTKPAGAPDLGGVSPDLRRLIEGVARYFKCPADELALIIEIAARDPEAARESFEDSARRGWIAELTTLEPDEGAA